MSHLTDAAAADLFRREPDGFIDVGGAAVAHRVVGSGPDVLFVHGWPVSGATFRRLLPHLADHVTCHVVDLPGAGSSRFTASTPVSLDLHIESVRKVVDHLGLDAVAVVGHDSGGMIARHAMAGDSRLRAMGLIDTEQSRGTGWRFDSFLAVRHLPGLAAGLGWVAGARRVRRNGFVLGDAFVDRSLLDGEFDEFFLRPLHDHRDRRDAAVRLLRTFHQRYVRALGDLHRRIDVPVQLVWGEADKFFPVAWAREMVADFADARLEDVAPLVAEMYRLQALGSRSGNGRSLPVDVNAPYFGHLKLTEGKKTRDVLVGNRGFVPGSAGGFAIVEKFGYTREAMAAYPALAPYRFAVGELLAVKGTPYVAGAGIFDVKADVAELALLSGSEPRHATLADVVEHVQHAAGPAHLQQVERGQQAGDGGGLGAHGGLAGAGQIVLE